VGEGQHVAVELGVPGLEAARPIGRGGFATVYRAWQPAFRRDVAVKLLHYARGDASALRRFHREVAAIGSVSAHPNVVSVYESGLAADGTPYLVMEHLPNGTLAELVADGPLPWDEAVALGRKLLAALGYAHGKEVLHSDIKPENVLLSQFGEPQLADFGIARIMGGNSTGSTQHHLTIPHAPPEVLDGAAATIAADLYSLASTVTHLIVGHAPFHRDGETSFVPMFGRILNEPPPDLRPLGVPEAVAAVLERALAKSPAARPASARELRSALGASTATPPPAPTVPAPLPVATVPRDEIVVVPDDEAAAAPAAPAARSATRRRRLAVIVVSAVAVLALGFVAVEALGTGRTGTGLAATSSTTSPSAAPVAATAAPPSTPAPVSVRTSRFRPGFGLLLPPGLTLQNDDAGFASFGRSSRETPLVFLNPARVYDPEESYGTAAISPFEEQTPNDLVLWLQEHPRLQVTKTEPVQFGEATGTRLWVEVTGSYSYTHCERPCVLLFNAGSGPVALLAGDTNHLDVVTVGARRLVVLAAAGATDTADLLPSLDRALATLRFD
jgi:hypothetical protein